MATDYSEASPVVQTTHGQVRGLLLATLYEESFYSFDGIPYAQPPLGELRFKEPKAVEPWLGILDCTQPKEKCLQVGSVSKQLEGSEDCLYLNIYVKNLSSATPLPVMVYVHGGRFLTGDASRRGLGPDYFMREQVVLASIGFRQGPFGFLSFADPSLGIPGNAGLKDIVLGLRWIKANVANFNGDPNNITLFGHSSGSCIVQLLMVSPQAEGLFDKAILMAGYMPETCSRSDVEFRTAKHLGYEGENVDRDVFNYINAADPRLLIKSDYRSLEEHLRDSSVSLFTPRVEYYDTPFAVLRAEPRVLQRKAWSNRMPIILGYSSNEGMVPAMFLAKMNPQILKLCRERPEHLLPYSMLQLADPDVARHLGQLLVKKFCGVHSTYLTQWHYPAIAELCSHNLLHYQQRLILARQTYGQAENYLYRFDFDSPDFNLYRARFLGPGSRGVLHADELSYLFRLPTTFKLDKSRPEYTAICRFIGLFTQFARSSDPNGPLTKSLVEWQPVAREGPTLCLNINEELKIIPQPGSWKLKFYERLYQAAEMEII